jgi:Flp pilus assembly protein TadD
LAARWEQVTNPSLWQRAAHRARLRRLEADYKLFIAQHPRHSAALVAYGGFLYDQHREEEGAQCWEKAVATDPQCAKAYNDLGQHYGHYGRAADALRYHQRASELDPTEPIYPFNWATTCILFRKDAQAVYGWDTAEIFQRSLDAFRKARDLAPAEPEFATAYAESFYAVPNADWEEALAAWEFCLRQTQDEVQRQRICSHLARVCLNLRRLDRARDWLAKMTLPEFLPVRKTLERRLAAYVAGSEGR